MSTEFDVADILADGYLPTEVTVVIQSGGGPLVEQGGTTLVERDGVGQGNLIEVASQGPQGIPGEKGAPGATALFCISAVNLSGHRAVLYYPNGSVGYATNTDPTHGLRVLGITTGAALQGDPVEVKLLDHLTEPSWNWDVSKPIYLGADGVLTQMQPTAPEASFILVVGAPTSPTSMFINVGIPITLT